MLVFGTCDEWPSKRGRYGVKVLLFLFSMESC